MTHAAVLDLVPRLADRAMAHPFKVWGYGEAIALEGLLAASDVTGDATYAAFVQRLLTKWVKTRPQIVPADHVAPGLALLEVYDRTRDQRLLNQATRMSDFFLSLPRTSHGAALHRYDQVDTSRWVYVDCMQLDAPFLCRLAQVTGSALYFRQAVDLILGHASVLRDAATGLFYHLYDDTRGRTNGAAWGRGNGWAMLGLLGALEALPSDIPGRQSLQAYLEELADAVVRLQDKSGHWHTVLDNPDTYLETSLAAFFALAFARGVQVGLLPVRYLDPAAAAWAALVSCVRDGVVTGVSQATPAGDANHYQQIPTGGPYPWGQGPALLAAAAQLHGYERGLTEPR